MSFRQTIRASQFTDRGFAVLVENGHEWFRFEELYLLSGFSFEAFLQAMEGGSVLIDFDARTGHNHGTKFRLRQGAWPSLYANVQRVFTPAQPLRLT
ncbi:MAG: MvaI/BcnI family restriction endonuclease [Armatimonadota bacterium]|nr:MvaI/BcnI family restriction endonuclease [bacterium]MDW8321192.1 MvaI/BcnI family restriction endonuclease [Armatimonadota bacterium]